MQQTIAEQLKEMTQEELLSLKEQLFSELRNRNDSGLEYGQKVMITGKYADHPSLRTEYGSMVFDDRYTSYVGTVAYVRDPTIHEEEGMLPWVTLKKTIKVGARTFNVHPDDIIVLGKVELEEYQPRTKKQ